MVCFRVYSKEKKQRSFSLDWDKIANVMLKNVEIELKFRLIKNSVFNKKISGHKDGIDSFRCNYYSKFCFSE